MKWLLGLLFPFSAFALGANPSAWIVGENYVATTHWKQGLKITEGVSPSSWAIEAESCSLWASTPTGSLIQLSENGRANITDKGTDALLTTVRKGVFYSRSLDQMDLEKRNSSGEIIGRWQRPWVKTVKQMVVVDDGAWALHLNGNRLWLTHLDSQWDETKQIEVSATTDLWNQPRLFVEEGTKNLWVGYSVTTPSHVYSPAVRKFDASGKPSWEYYGKDRGLFFDGCLDDGQGFLFSRDLPSSSGFTLPISSFLEFLNTKGELSPEYEAELNYYIDSVRCAANRVYMLQRSVFSSSGTYLVEWKRGSSGAGSPLFKLPGTAQAIELCQAR